MRPKIGLIPGDPSGIGPELCARLLAENVVSDADILLIGDRHVFELGQKQAGLTHLMVEVDAANEDWTKTPHFAFHPMQTIVPDEVDPETFDGCTALLEFVQAGVIDAICFAPFNKASMHLAGIGHADELHYMAEKLGATGYISELNTLDGMWTSRVTSHIALREVADVIDGERIKDDVLRRAGYDRPRIAVAALNPHAGDNGNFGREEIDVIEPAVRELAESQMAVEGPTPSDTVFLKVTRGELDAVVTMYHDQGQIALKLLGFDRGVTVQGGLPVPVTTPAHGTAFDIAGEGKADVGAMKAAFQIACNMVMNWDRAVAEQWNGAAAE